MPSSGQVPIASGFTSESDPRVLALFENPLVGMVRLDTNGLVRAANSAAAAILGFDSPDALVSENASVPAASSWVELTSLLQASDRESGSPYTKEMSLSTKGGGSVDLHVSVFPLKDEEDQPNGFEILFSPLNLVNEVDDHIKEAQRLEALGQLTGGVAHDFNNLLTVINTNAELLAWSIDTDDSRHPLVAEIEAAARSGAQLVQGLLGAVRETDPVLTVIGLKAAVASAVGMLRRVLAANIQVVAELPQQELHIQGNTASIQQIILNMGTNARDAMPDGGQLRFTVRGVRVDQEDDPDWPEITPGPYAEIVIEDSGQGIGPETLRKIFDPFFTTKAPGRGTGLGLAMVQSLVSKHGGWIRVDSTVGEGTTFTIRIPTTRADRKSLVGMQRGAIPTGSETVLLVDDNQSLQVAARRALEKLGYTVLTAPDGRTALEILQAKSEHIDLVLSDMVMPRMGGVELYRASRELPHEIEFILASGHTEAEVRSEQDLPRDLQVLQKPWTLADLAWTIKDTLHPTPELL